VGAIQRDKTHQGTNVSAPKNVQVDFNVRVTHTNPAGDRIPLARRVSFATRSGGMSIHLDWLPLSDVADAGCTSAECGDEKEDVLSVAEAQEWLQQKMRVWSGGA
jgi:hypothetical protein